MLHRRVLTALACLWLGAGIAQAAPCNAPASTLHPGTAAEVPEGAASLAGTWHGMWPIAVRQHVYPRCARLYIEVTGAQTAIVEQCLGALAQGKLKPECKQYVGQIADRTLSFSDFDGTAFSFTLADVGGMLATQSDAEHRSVTNFTKGP